MTLQKKNNLLVILKKVISQIKIAKTSFFVKYLEINLHKTTILIDNYVEPFR